MQRIQQNNVKVNDADRHKKRRETFRKKRLKKSFINRTLKPVYDGHELKKYNLNDVNKPRPPFYDPWESHMHIWRTGVIPCAQDQFDKYHKIVKPGQEPFKGRYCIICHLVSHPFTMNNSSDCINNHTLNLSNAVDLFLQENKEEDIIKNFSNLNIDEEHRFNVIRGEGLHEDLFIPNFLCKFYINSDGFHDGKVLKLLEDNMLIVEDLMGKQYEINGSKIFMNYDGYINNNTNHISIFNKDKKNYPVWFPPSSVLPGVVYEYRGNKFTRKDIWIQKWTNFIKWKGMVEYLKQYLYDNYMNDDDTYNYIPYKDTLKQHRESMIREFNNNKKNCKFLLPNNTVKRSFNTYHKVIKNDIDLFREMNKLTINPVKKRKVVNVC